MQKLWWMITAHDSENTWSCSSHMMEQFLEDALKNIFSKSHVLLYKDVMRETFTYFIWCLPVFLTNRKKSFNLTTLLLIGMLPYVIDPIGSWVFHVQILLVCQLCTGVWVDQGNHWMRCSLLKLANLLLKCVILCKQLDSQSRYISTAVDVIIWAVIAVYSVYKLRFALEGYMHVWTFTLFLWSRS